MNTQSFPNNVNGIEFKTFKHIANVNDNDNNDNVAKARKVDEIADRLVDKLGNPAARKYYCLIAWSLPEVTIWNNLETALTYTGPRKDSSPKRYFTWLCEKDLSRKRV